MSEAMTEAMIDVEIEAVNRPIAALHFLLPTGESIRTQEFRFQTNLPSPARRGSRSRLPLRRPRLLRFERLRVSVESIQPRPPRPCEVGRPKGRRRKNRRQSHNFFSTDAAGGTPTRRHALGRLPTPPPLPENLLLGLHRKLPSVPPASTQEVSESENRPATRGTAHSEVQGDERGND